MVRRWCNYVCAEWSGARSHDCGNIPGTLGLHKESTSVGELEPKLYCLARMASFTIWSKEWKIGDV
jgi:hypothetical protein